MRGLQSPRGEIRHLCELAAGTCPGTKSPVTTCHRVLRRVCSLGDSGLPLGMYRDKCAWGPSGLRAFAQGFTVARSCSPERCVAAESPPRSPRVGSTSSHTPLELPELRGPASPIHRLTRNSGAHPHHRAFVALSHRETESPSRHQEMPFLDCQSERGCGRLRRFGSC